ncbi:hypothetical protein EV401DRAFT_2017939 [Pisolithus croceorrhizus]|nr:hypothetical protein EV401DRAFT_2017939 [Pisolithus croceorrhizus]
MWEKIQLSENYSKASEQELVYWPNFIIHECKQRAKVPQYLIKMGWMKLRQDFVQQCIIPKTTSQ